MSQRSIESTAEASAYPASSALPMWPQNMVITNGRRKFKIRDNSCRNKKKHLTKYQTAHQWPTNRCSKLLLFTEFGQFFCTLKSDFKSVSSQIKSPGTDWFALFHLIHTVVYIQYFRVAADCTVRFYSGKSAHSKVTLQEYSGWMFYNRSTLWITYQSPPPTLQLSPTHQWAREP